MDKNLKRLSQDKCGYNIITVPQLILPDSKGE